MEVIGLAVADRFCKKHARAKKSLYAILKLLKENTFKSFLNLTETFKTADYVYHVFTIFDVAGNNYRMITIIDYEFEIVEIKYIWTHAEYDKNQVTLKREAKKHVGG
ncbi:type II toxin-antitoxin system HigB family toxin [Thiotrichales bacterium 19S9-12]|nr:type II toxin-antitoxin system HigB family toxin [Thiotrichales bacterium 19S9-11]MCF6812457.1 type II toxin-antitoxin system HigB family toxin [Thiotrichales bacterium 19S9-12]